MPVDLKTIVKIYEVMAKIPQLKDFLFADLLPLGDSYTLRLVSWKSQEIDVGLEDKLRFVATNEGINLTEIGVKKIPRSHYVKKALELSDILKIDINCSIGNPSHPEDYVAELLKLGEEMRSSDVYICPDTGDHAQQGIVQMKVDGRLRTLDRVSLDDLARISSELKNKLGEKQETKNKSHALEGSFYSESSPETQYRVSVMQTNSCASNTTSSKRLDSVVVRILKTRDIDFSLEELGYLPEDVEKIKTIIKERSGVILVTGKTGTGKSTTMGSMLTELYKQTNGEEKIITFEDPIEYRIRGALQFQVVARSEADQDEYDKMSYYTALKNCLRQAPDVIMLGEVRDAQTAKSLFDTAQTGHLLLSSMHSKTIISALTRLASFGVDGSVMNDSLLGVVSQTLIRMNCPACIHTRPMTENEMRYFFQTPAVQDEDYQRFMERMIRPEVAESTGVVNGVICAKCEGTQFYGRKPIVEIYIHQRDDEKHTNVIADICNGDPLGPIRMNDLFKQGVHEPFALNALKHMFYHTTSPQEVMRHLPPSIFRDYSKLLVKKTNEFIENS